jgi:hypothetical protein
VVVAENEIMRCQREGNICENGVTYCRQAHVHVARYTDWPNISHCSPAPRNSEKYFPCNQTSVADIRLTVRSDNKSRLITEDRDNPQRKKILVKYCNK